MRGSLFASEWVLWAFLATLLSALKEAGLFYWEILASNIKTAFPHVKFDPLSYVINEL